MRDAESFDEFYRATSRRLLGYCYALTGDLSQAQDLVQEAYLRAWQRWRRIEHYGNTEAWLRLVVSRMATDVWRRTRTFRATLARLGRPEAARAPTEDMVMVVRALRGLPDGQRQALALHYLYDLSVADISAETGAPTGTVKSWLARGRTALAASLTDGPLAVRPVGQHSGLSEEGGDE